MTLPITSAQGQALLALRVHAPNVKFVVIGAAAVGHYVRLARPTADVDLAIAVGEHDLNELLGTLGWKRDPRMLQRWHGPDGFMVDALPASAELLRAGRVRFDGGDVEMSLIGFDLALDHAVPVLVPGYAQPVYVASLAALVVLKMVAWVERPFLRNKDLGDLAILLEQALAADDDRRWDAAHPVGAAQLEYDQQSPFFVGLSVAEIAQRAHRACVETFLERVGSDQHAWHAVMAREAGYLGEDPEGLVARALAAFETGFRSTS
jgi:predicted nucleotidyltransferase